MSVCQDSAAQEAQLVFLGIKSVILAFMISEWFPSVWQAFAKETFHFSWNCDSSVAQQCRRAFFHPFVHRASEGTFCSDLTHWSVPRHPWCRLEAITAVRFSQSTKINLNRESEHLNYLDCLATYRPTLIWLNLLISSSSSANPKWSLYLFLISSYGGDPCRDSLFHLIFINKH